MSADLAGHPVLAPDILTGFHLLEADAGTGKTWTLSGLVVRALVERGLGIEQILVVTFTNAATAELAARIRERIAQLERLIEDRLDGRATDGARAVLRRYCARLEDAAAGPRRLRVALARVDEMAVHTIHGFCQRVIDEHALSIGVRRCRRGRDRRPEWIPVAHWWRARDRGAPAGVLALRLADDSRTFAPRCARSPRGPGARRAGPATGAGSRGAGRAARASAECLAARPGPCATGSA